MTYRDDRQALHDRIAALTAELEELRAAPPAAAAATPAAAAATEPPPPAEATTPARQPTAEERNASRRVAAAGALAAALVVAGLAAIAWPREPDEDAPTVLAAVPDPPTAVDPLAVLGMALARAPAGEELTQLEAWYVSTDGTIDLTSHAYQGRVEVRTAAPPAPQPAPTFSAPLGAPPPAQISFVHTDTFTLDRRGLAHTTSEPFGLWLTAAVPRPRCTPRAVWTAARAAGAPDAVAHLTYARPMGGTAAAWTFEIEGTSYRYEVSERSCRVERGAARPPETARPG